MAEVRLGIIGLGNDKKNQMLSVNEMARYSGYHFVGELGASRPYGVSTSAMVVTRARMQIAKAAVCLYRAEVGSLPLTLDALVPKYLPSVPLDPYDGKPIRYRISTGESIEWEFETQRDASTQRLPGFEFVTEEEWHAHMAIGGGSLAQGHSPLVKKIPGISEDGNQTVDLRAVAAVMGGVVQWPLEPLDEENAFGFGPGVQPVIGDGRGKYERNPVFPNDRTRERREILPSQAILWSTGPDRFDDGGKRQFIHLNSIGNAGRFEEDIIEVVPLSLAQRKPK